jgi:hypothetical protein
MPGKAGLGAILTCSTGAVDSLGGTPPAVEAPGNRGADDQRDQRARLAPFRDPPLLRYRARRRHRAIRTSIQTSSRATVCTSPTRAWSPNHVMWLEMALFDEFQHLRAGRPRWPSVRYAIHLGHSWRFPPSCRVQCGLDWRPRSAYVTEDEQPEPLK